jgi:hypothetical protein
MVIMSILKTMFWRPINLLRAKEIRAASPYTSNWGVERLLLDPATRKTAVKNALGRGGILTLPRAFENVNVAMALLTGDSDPKTKEAIVKCLIEGIIFKQAKFLRGLAKQSPEDVKKVHDIWIKFSPADPKRYADDAGEWSSKVYKPIKITDRLSEIECTEKSFYDVLLPATNTIGYRIDGLYFLFP